VGHCLEAGADLLKSSQPEQVEGRRPEGRQGAGTIAPVAVGILMELGVTNPVPALNAPAISHQLQQGFWGGAQAREEQVGGPEGLVVTSAGGSYLHDPAGTDPVLADVLRRLYRFAEAFGFSPQRPDDVAAVAISWSVARKGIWRFPRN
jgi:hypothetical protein